MLLSQFKEKYLDEFSKKTPENGVDDETSPLAIIIGRENTAEIIDSSPHESNRIISMYKNGIYEYELPMSDYLLTQKFSALLNECSKQLNAPVKSDTSKKTNYQKKYTEEKYEYITEYGTQILALFNPSGFCTYLSGNFEKLTKQPATAQIGNNFFALIHPDFQNKLRDALRPIPVFVAAGMKKQILRLKMQNGDGKYYWYEFTIHTQTNSTQDNKSQTEQYVCIIENIHKNMQIQNTLQKARLEAELALRARSEFLANMSHELRTPLNAVIGFSQIMEKGIFGKIDNPQYAGYVRHIQESGHDLLAKIEDLLEIANIDAGRVSLGCEEIHVNDLIKHVIKTQSHHSQVAKVSLSYIPKGNILLFIDRMKIQHILGHLVTNSIKFNRSGGEVTIEIDREEKNGIRISVHDNGIGMNDLKCHDIREALQQDNCWTARNSHHIGIGLALTKEFVSLHGGTVKINSSLGIGTTVSIYLPRGCIRLTPAKRTTDKKQSIKQLDLCAN